MNNIIKHQTEISKKNINNKQIALLKKSSMPLKWTSSKTGKITEVSTTETIRSKELLNIFESLCTECFMPSERLDILLTAKKIASNYDCKIAFEIIELINREAEFITRGMPSEQMFGLRQRIKNRFMQFSKLPIVNPGISKHLDVHLCKKENKTLEFNTFYYCPSCDKYMKNKAFPLSAKVKTLTPCESCRRQDNRARKRLNLKPYQRMLRSLRRKEVKIIKKLISECIKTTKEMELQKLEEGKEPDEETMTIFNLSEEKIKTINPYPFLVDKDDIRFIVDEIWEKRSVLSESTEINDLTLVRWKREKLWSPWNTILVTHKEAEAHLELGNLNIEETYAESLISIIRQRLIVGRNAFNKLKKDSHTLSKEILENLKPFEDFNNKKEYVLYGKTKPPSFNSKTRETIC